MKILIPLTILVISFIIYYFFTTPSVPKIQNSIPLETSDIIEPPRAKRTEHPYLPDLATLKQKPQTKEIPLSEREVLTLDDLKKGLTKSKKKSTQQGSDTKSYNQMIFIQLKKILQNASSTYYAKKHIVLNSYVSSILSSQQSREKFKVLLSSDFGLDDATIEEGFQKNRTVWDWVLFLSP